MNKVFRFVDYEQFIYLNTNMPKSDARLIAKECWSKGLDKFAALAEARKLYGRKEKDNE